MSVEAKAPTIRRSSPFQFSMETEWEGLSSSTECKNRLYCGIPTGLDNAFLDSHKIDDQTRQELQKIVNNKIRIVKKTYDTGHDIDKQVKELERELKVYNKKAKNGESPIKLIIHHSGDCQCCGTNNSWIILTSWNEFEEIS